MPHPYPKNPAETDHSILEVIQNRWSPIAFSSDAIEEEKIQRLFEAARWAPSSYNEQPWRFLYATKDDEEAFEKIGSLLLERNEWAKNAYMLVLVYSSKKYKQNETSNQHHMYDTGSAVQNLVLQAASMDLITHMMGGFDKEKSQELYGLDPEMFESICMMAAGHAGDESELDEGQLERQRSKRERMKIEEFAKELS